MPLYILVLVLLLGLAAGLTRDYISVTETTLNWTNAQKYCKESYMNLASVTTDEENQRLYTLIGDTASAWIGMYRAKIMENIWLWSDGTPSSFFQWHTNQPNNIDGNQNCVEMTPGGWNDQFCIVEDIFVCQQVLVLVKEKMSWEEALDYCRKNYTGLASPASETQIQLAELESTQTQTDGVWTGLRFLDGKWVCMSQEPLENLLSLPSCPAPGLRCGARNIKTHLWESRDCNEKLNFLCYY